MLINLKRFDGYDAGEINEEEISGKKSSKKTVLILQNRQAVFLFSSLMFGKH